MALKKTRNCCRYCKHRGWGKVLRNNDRESMVCLLKPKFFKHPEDNIEPHYFATTMTEYCEKYEPIEKEKHG